jgi:hypothetical protein
MTLATQKGGFLTTVKNSVIPESKHHYMAIIVGRRRLMV